MTTTRLGDQIKGFIEVLAAHDIVAQKAGHGRYDLFWDSSGHEADRMFLMNVGTADELAAAVEHFERVGWPEMPTPSKNDKGSKLPKWVIAHDGLVQEGRSILVDTPKDSTMTDLVVDAIQSLDGIVTFQALVDELHRKYPLSKFNYKSISATISTACKNGLMRSHGRGSFSALVASPTVDSTPADVEFTLLSLLSMGSKWSIVGRLNDGSPVYTVGDGGELFKVNVEVVRL